MELIEALKNFTVICGVIAIVIKVFVFITAIQHKTEENSKEIKRIKEKLDADYNSIEYLKKSNRHLCTFMIEMNNHMITGNHVDKLQEVRDDILTFITEEG